MNKKHKGIDPAILADVKELGLDTWEIDNYAEPCFGIQIPGKRVIFVHPATECTGRHCVVHDPSDHHMRSWSINYRADKGLTERLCSHGIGHPDPDDMIYHRLVGNDWKGVHGCDGCCRKPEKEINESERIVYAE